MAGVYCHRDLVTLTMVHLVSLQRYRLASECPTRGPSVARTITNTASNSVLQVLHPSLDDPLRDHIAGQHQKPSKFSTRLLLQVTPDGSPPVERPARHSLPACAGQRAAEAEREETCGETSRCRHLVETSLLRQGGGATPCGQRFHARLRMVWTGLE